MHELSLALDLVELATAEAERIGNVRVVALHLRLGPLAGVVEEALRFSFDVAAADTPIAGARLEILPEAVLAWCPHCEEARALADVRIRCCSECGRPTPELTAGDAFELTGLEVIDHEHPHH